MLSRRSFLVSSSAWALSMCIPGVKAQTLIDVPFYSQHNNLAYGDCGEAVWKMLRLWADPTDAMTLPQISELWGKDADAASFMDIHHEPHMADMGFEGYYTEHASSADWFRGKIDAGCPCVALVDYSYFALENQAGYYVDGHYVLVVGYTDDALLINDPLFAYAEQGANRPISNGEWLAASTGLAIVITGATQ